jgi:hypothetical protein
MFFRTLKQFIRAAISIDPLFFEAFLPECLFTGLRVFPKNWLWQSAKPKASVQRQDLDNPLF